ncbi:prolyl aminopeptidase [Alteromonadaceae bacterium M269]|nr:prolyl aminopeptidase [Alteromonadaceae bacterium M269]
MSEFFPEIEPYDTRLVDVGDSHQVYVEQCGNADGQPVVFVHGGPGGGCSEKDRRFFDPDKYRIILFDQRGCGRSVPHGLLQDNNTQLLVSDMELIRQLLGIDTWHVFGGSWGSTLSLVYAQSHPEKVRSLVLRGIFLARPQDIEWTFNGGGAARLFPEYWADFVNAFPHKSVSDYVAEGYELMLGEDKKLARKIAHAWTQWELRCCTLLPNAEFVAENLDEDHCWTLARHEAHFMKNACFLSDNQILNNCHLIEHIPTVIVHGRYDIVCPFDNATALHQRLPKSSLKIAEDSGHASSEESTRALLVEATQHMVTI